jgi:hypothetical protein
MTAQSSSRTRHSNVADAGAADESEHDVVLESAFGGLKRGQMLEQKAFISGSVAGIQDAWMFDNPSSTFVMQGIEHENPGLVRVFVCIRSPKSFQSGE